MGAQPRGSPPPRGWSPWSSAGRPRGWGPPTRRWTVRACRGRRGPLRGSRLSGSWTCCQMEVRRGLPHHGAGPYLRGQGAWTCQGPGGGSPPPRRRRRTRSSPGVRATAAGRPPFRVTRGERPTERVPAAPRRGARDSSPSGGLASGTLSPWTSRSPGTASRRPTRPAWPSRDRGTPRCESTSRTSARRSSITRWSLAS